jgi:ubiquinone/menaquinone biosynthesis C-methylase UbiE
VEATFWDKRSQKYDEKIKKHDFIYRKTIEKTKLHIKSPYKVLDFGCGSGEISLNLLSKVKFIHGIDVPMNKWTVN